MYVNKGGSQESHQRNKIVINGTDIETVSEIKYLGVIIDNKLNFKHHKKWVTNTIEKKKKIGYLHRVSRQLSMWTKSIIFNTIIKPHYNYCSKILAVANEKEGNKLQKLQSRAARIILKESWLSDQREMLNKLKWKNVKENFEIDVCTFIFKILHGKMPKYLENILKCKDHKHDTRSERNSCVEGKANNSIFYRGVRKFYALPANIKDEKDFVKFSRKLENYVSI